MLKVWTSVFIIRVGKHLSCSRTFHFRGAELLFPYAEFVTASIHPFIPAFVHSFSFHISWGQDFPFPIYRFQLLQQEDVPKLNLRCRLNPNTPYAVTSGTVGIYYWLLTVVHSVSRQANTKDTIETCSAAILPVFWPRCSQMTYCIPTNAMGKKIRSAMAEMFKLVLMLTFVHYQRHPLDTVTTAFASVCRLLSIFPAGFLLLQLFRNSSWLTGLCSVA